VITRQQWTDDGRKAATEGSNVRRGSGSERQFKIYCADAGSRRFLYMRLLSDFERLPALHLTLANTPLHLKQLCDVVQTRAQKKR
jgi:hypothetical protein